jgi:RNA polymerase I-specific transcription initiation factor RRN6
LQSERTGTRPHADVSFNPWYNQQFAILDEQGNWSIWSIEGLQRKRAKTEASPGKSGHIHDGLLQDESLPELRNADGWGRVLWAASLSTIIICQRRHLAIFDLKAHPKRLYSPALVDAKATDWIVDVKRSPLRLDQIFVLTTTQIFWLQVTATDERVNQDDGYAGARILLSCHHFRDEEDETMKLEIMSEYDGR